jgi:nucleoid DNA-binding protein
MTVTKAGLSRALRKAAGLPYREAAFCVDFLVEAIAAEAARGRRVELRGLGSFSVTRVKVKFFPASRSEEKTVPAHGKITFRPSASLRRAAWNAGQPVKPEGKKP